MSLSITVSHRTETACNTKNLSIKYVSSVAHSTETDCNTKKKKKTELAHSVCEFSITLHLNYLRYERYWPPRYAC